MSGTNEKMRQPSCHPHVAVARVNGRMLSCFGLYPNWITTPIWKAANIVTTSLPGELNRYAVIRTQACRQCGRVSWIPAVQSKWFTIKEVAHSNLIELAQRSQE